MNTTAYTNGIGNDSGSLFIGRYETASQRLNGSLDDVRVYNYARTPAQVAWDYNRGGPVGLWKLDECTGTTAYDASGKGNNGTITIAGSGSQTTAGNCVTTDTAAAWYNGRNGKFNSSLNFDGTDDFVNIDGIAADIQSGSATIAFWFQPAATFNSANTQNQYLFELGDTTSTNDLTIRLDEITGGVNFYHLDSGGTLRSLISTQTSWTGGTWYHVVGTLEVNVIKKLYIKLYINGPRSGDRPLGLHEPQKNERLNPNKG